jgi:hypothetical protein
VVLCAMMPCRLVRRYRKQSEGVVDSSKHRFKVTHLLCISLKQIFTTFHTIWQRAWRTSNSFITEMNAKRKLSVLISQVGPSLFCMVCLHGLDIHLSQCRSYYSVTLHTATLDVVWTGQRFSYACGRSQFQISFRGPPILFDRIFWFFLAFPGKCIKLEIILLAFIYIFVIAEQYPNNSR